jgi:hypothetical protein
MGQGSGFAGLDFQRNGGMVSRIEWETFFTSCQIHRVLLWASAMRNGVQRWEGLAAELSNCTLAEENMYNIQVYLQVSMNC